MSRSSVSAASVVAAILVSLSASGSVATAADQGRPDRTAVVGIDFDPPCLNVLLNDCNFAVAATIAGTALGGRVPRACRTSRSSPFWSTASTCKHSRSRSRTTSRRKAKWSDGTPVTADDFIFTLETILDPATTRLRDAGYEPHRRVRQGRCEDGDGSASARRTPTGGRCFRYVLPKHVLAGHDFDQVWRDEIADPVTHEPIGSGPFLITGWTRGSR